MGMPRQGTKLRPRTGDGQENSKVISETVISIFIRRTAAAASALITETLITDYFFRIYSCPFAVP